MSQAKLKLNKGAVNLTQEEKADALTKLGASEAEAHFIAGFSRRKVKGDVFPIPDGSDCAERGILAPVPHGKSNTAL